MASLAIASIDSSHQAHQQNDEDMPRGNEASNLNFKEIVVPGSNIDNASKAITPQHPNPASRTPDLEWKAGKEEWMIILVIAIVSLMVALDATILVPVLPVGASELDVKKLSRGI